MRRGGIAIFYRNNLQGVLTMVGKMWVVQMLFMMIIISDAFAGNPFSASVRKIIDGDSLVVATAHDTIEVRLYGVDCPEYDQPFSREAKRFTEDRVLGKKVMIEPVARDSYGRLVAVVVRDNKVLNKDLVQAGLAWVYPGYCKKSFCRSWKESENFAHKERRGLWHDKHPDPPWRWRR
ncbi:MAG: nuclease [uncultured bacterium]|nr:MAG: nuclease [uncultured bacterium]